MSEFTKDPNERGALWEKDGPKGTYMTGVIDGQPVVVFRNHKRSSEKAPHWRVLKSQPKGERAASSRTDEDVPF